MLNPMDVLSVTASAVQFVDFSVKILSKGNEIYKSTSGTVQGNTVIESTSNTILHHEERLRKSLGISSLTIPHVISSSEADLLELCQNCLEIAAKLSMRLDDLKVNGANRSRWKSVRQALKSEWNKTELNEMRDTLVVYKNDLVLHILMSVRENINLHELKLSEEINHVSKDVTQVLDFILKNHGALKSEICLRTDAISRTQVSMEKKIAAESTRIVQEMKNLESAQEERRRRTDTYHKILHSLRFREIDDRHGSISHAERCTFSWVFTESLGTNRLWSNLALWLRRDERLYWINGKPGSGKSTLMRYIYDHPKTRRYLSLWAGKVPLVTAGFFFWNSGVLQQKTQIGLLRTLLYQILDQRQDLIPNAFPEQWKRTYEKQLWSTEPEVGSNWSITQLQKSLSILIRQSAGKVKFGLFIDGLDEHDSNHVPLIAFIKDLATNEHVKILVSSRPLLEFENGFRNLPTMKLQDLTYNDIKSYIDSRFRSDPNVVVFFRKDPSGALNLVKEVVEAANGVFLWVRLAVDSLLEGITYRDRLSHLQERLRALPRDLESMFDQMLGRVNPVYLEHSSRLFQLIRSAQEDAESEKNTHGRIYSLLLSFAQEEDDNDIYGPPISSSEDALIERCTEIRAWLKTRCAGLLETQSTSEWKVQGNELVLYAQGSLPNRFDMHSFGDLTWTVSYIHRSARDYLEQPKVWGKIISYTAGTRFDTRLAWVRGWARFLKTVEPTRQVLRNYDISLLSMAIDSALTLCYHCHTGDVSEAEETKMAGAVQGEVLKKISHHLLDPRVPLGGLRWLENIVLSRSYPPDRGGYIRAALLTRTVRCTDCRKVLIDKDNPKKPCIISSPPSPCNPGYGCSFFLNDLFRCPYTALSIAEIESHFKQHLWRSQSLDQAMPRSGPIAGTLAFKSTYWTEQLSDYNFISSSRNSTAAEARSRFNTNSGCKSRRCLDMRASIVNDESKRLDVQVEENHRSWGMGRFH